MMEQFLVSIVLPTYNGAMFLHQSILSCLNQTYKNIELIIVDDASNDETLAIIERFQRKDTRIHVIRHKENRKLPGALNSGFLVAKGQYLTWTSDDNFYSPDAIGEMVAVLENNPEIDVVYADHFNIDSNGQILHVSSVGAIGDLIFYNCIGACFLYRRRVQEYLERYNESLFLAEDYDFWLRASLNFKFQEIHKTLYYYRCHNNSLTERHKREVFAATVNTLEKHLPRMPNVNRDMKAKIYLNFLYTAYLFKDIEKVCTFLQKALIFSPRYVFKRVKDRILKKVLKCFGK
jgi:glycosyltransferase involved in cell wall biosynthesis